MTEVTDYVCFEISDDGFICNEQPDHDGDHIATAFQLGGPSDEKREVRRWRRAEGSHD